MLTQQNIQQHIQQQLQQQQVKLKAQQQQVREYSKNFFAFLSWQCKSSKHISFENFNHLVIFYLTWHVFIVITQR